METLNHPTIQNLSIVVPSEQLNDWIEQGWMPTREATDSEKDEASTPPKAKRVR